MRVARRVHVRYQGSDAALVVPFGDLAAIQRGFEAAYRQRFSFLMQGRTLVVEAVSVEAQLAGDAPAEPLAPLGAPRPAPVRVTSPRVARILERLMVGVVSYGTGTAASLAPVGVAGKTGTAELEDTTDEEGLEQSPGSDTDAWFTAYAPVKKPKLAVAVLLVRNGAGGETAAPAARVVLQAGLAR